MSAEQRVLSTHRASEARLDPRAGMPKAHVEAPPGTSAIGRLFQVFLQAMGNPAVAATLWDGETVGHPDAAVRLRIGDRHTALRLMYNPDLEFGEAYTDGRLLVDGDLVHVLEILYRTQPGGLAARLLRRGHRPRSNTLAGSRHNIHRHYDLGNAFYRLWLDERMVYTCAYFPSRDASLEEAQLAKMEHVCRKMALRPGERVVEAGCGWGSLALHMARHHGVTVRAFNISHEQISHAREQAHAEGLADRVEFIEDDYRNITGTYDAFVSVGMLEHVGPDHYRDLSRVIDRCLPGHGRGLIHTIGRNRPEMLNAWIERHIFPGAHPPTLREMMAIFEPANFSVLDVENLRLHYAQTLRHWKARYERAERQVAAMFDERFVRAWRLYLAGSIAGFTTGTLQLFQVLFARAAHNGIPWTRAHLYATPE